VILFMVGRTASYTLDAGLVVALERYQLHNSKAFARRTDVLNSWLAMVSRREEQSAIKGMTGTARHDLHPKAACKASITKGQTLHKKAEGRHNNGRQSLIGEKDNEQGPCKHDAFARADMKG
jgi:seryl-tRNA(Sec) selenium transferase